MDTTKEKQLEWRNVSGTSVRRCRFTCLAATLLAIRARAVLPFEKESCYARRIRRRLHHANKDSHHILESHRQQDSCILGRLTN